MRIGVVEELRCLEVGREALGEPIGQAKRRIAPQAHALAEGDVLALRSPRQRRLAADVQARRPVRQERQATVTRERVARQHVDPARQVNEPTTAGQRRRAERASGRATAGQRCSAARHGEVWRAGT